MILGRAFGRVVSRPANSQRFVHLANPTMHVSKYPGTRIIELQNEDNHNQLTSDVCKRIQTHLESYSINKIVDIVIFSSGLNNVFSAKNSSDVADVKSGHALSNFVANYKKETVTFYNGEVNGTAFGVFQSSKYRLGTTSTKLAISEITRSNTIPTGGLAYYLSNNLKDGIAIGRYLGVTGTPVNTATLLELGLLTNFVEDDGHHILADCLSHSVSEDALSSSYQPEVITKDSLEEILRTMDIRDDTDIVNEPVFDRYSIIPRSVVEESISNDSAAMARELETFSEFRAPLMQRLNLIDMCFSVKSVDACVKKLESLLSSKSQDAASFARETLDKMNKANPYAVEAWFRLTRDAKSRTLAEVQEAELQELQELAAHKGK